MKTNQLTFRLLIASIMYLAVSTHGWAVSFAESCGSKAQVIGQSDSNTEQNGSDEEEEEEPDCE